MLPVLTTGAQLAPAREGNNFFQTAGDSYQHLTAWAAPGDAITG